jgi:bacterioferritin-associated ferredoxin
MDPDDHVCLCFRVSLRKLRTFTERERPPVASRLADCLGAGTGCQWCVPFLRRLHEQWSEGKPMDLPVAPEEYAARRAVYRNALRHDQHAPPGEPPTGG